MFQIEYFVINLKHTLNDNKKFFAVQLKDVCDRDITYMNIPCIQAVIDFKWKTYTFWFFAKKFIALLMFALSLLIDLLICKSVYVTDPDETHKCQIATRSVCGIIMSYFFVYEIRQVFKVPSLLSHFGSIWNVFDSAFIIAYICYLPISFLSYDLVIISTQAVVLMLTFIKTIYFLRIFQDFSFMINMLTQVFVDLRFFLSFFALFIGVFTVLMTLIITHDELATLSHPAAGMFGYVLIVLETSIGQGEGLKEYITDYHTTLTYMIWFTITLVGNIIFMNFIIAVVNSSYTNCMDSMDA